MDSALARLLRFGNADLGPDSADKAAILELLSASDDDGQMKHYYILVKPGRYIEYKYNVAKNIPFDLEDFGRILDHGDGALPAEGRQALMALNAGIDHTLIARNKTAIALAIENLKARTSSRP